MPYAVIQKDGKWAVINKTTRRVLGTHPTRKDALQQLRALYSNVPDARKK